MPEVSRWRMAVASIGIAGVVLLASGPARTQEGSPQGRKLAPSFFPNTEQLGADEMRITALGTGMPTPITRAAEVSIAWIWSSWATATKFIFDIGMGSMANLFSLRPDFSKLDKVFAQPPAHRPRGRFHDASMIGGWLSGRYTPIHIYGADRLDARSSARKRLRSRACRRLYAWDLQGPDRHRCPTRAVKIEVHEFDYKGRRTRSSIDAKTA